MYPNQHQVTCSRLRKKLESASFVSLPAMVDSQRGTRLILSNLPPSLTNDQLRQHVARCPPQPPQLTDVKLLLKPDGTFRRMAFIGFKNSDEADTTRRWLQGSYVHGSSSGARIKVDWAKEVGINVTIV